MTPLLVAAAGGHVECVKVLLEKGAEIDSQSNVSGESYSIDCIISYLISFDKTYISDIMK